MSKIDLSVMKIVTLVKEEALTIGGGFSLEKGVSMLAGHGVSGSLTTDVARFDLSHLESDVP
jgi:uncharacterized protein GlcG (DUF336 family)